MSSLAITAGGLLLMVATIATTFCLARLSPFYRQELLSAGGNRELPLDGLRGMAALLVMAYHAALFRTQLIDGSWGETGSPVLQVFGPGGVLIFFMLTGCLFWNKARGANGKLPVLKLWRGRFFRIAPLYLASLAGVLLLAIFLNGSHWLSVANWKPLSRLATLGAIKWIPIGEVDLGAINSYVVWTLWFEWRFYLLLPFIAWFAVGRRTFWLALLAYAAAFLGPFVRINLQLCLVFVLGMLCPVLLDDARVRNQLRHPLASGLALANTVVMCSFIQTFNPTITLGGALFPLFLVVAAGNNLFGFLTHPAIRCLGTISYSVYLLHAVVFYVAIHLLTAAGLTDTLLRYYWAFITAIAVVATALCALTYRWIEFPFLARSHSGVAAAKPPA